jgi:diphthamide synthase subunit DPH2
LKEVFWFLTLLTKKKTKDEIFAFRFAQAISSKFGYTKNNPYDEKLRAFNKARDNKISEIILQLELGAKKEELEQMLSNISIEV